MDSQLRFDEEFVIRSLAIHYSGDWEGGEKPPDAYLQMCDKLVAVEISTLTQNVSDGRGGSKPRLSEDSTATWLANELNAELQEKIPDGPLVIPTLASPILKARQVKTQLKDKIVGLISNLCGIEVSEIILGNRIAVYVATNDRSSGKKVVGVITNQKSSSDIPQNTRQILEDRISVRAGKCYSSVFEGLKWLALFNDYWLADNDTYQQAIGSLSLNHPFEKILLVSGNGSVAVLHEKLLV
jgi:hypothetical protein